MTEFFAPLPMEEIDKENQRLYEQYPDVIPEALAAEEFLRNVAVGGFMGARDALVAARVAARPAKEFYDKYMDSVQEIALREDRARSSVE
jgi:hypothetical protein